MMLVQVALVSETTGVSFAEVARVSAELQKQAIRDLRPIWSIHATVDAFASLEDVPVGYWPVVIKDNINTPGAAGIHEDKDGQPFALVQSGSGWSLTASHETLEMLVDPFGNRLVAGQSPDPRQGRVEFLVEVCDPSEDAAFSYHANGITVSDFYTPHYFDPVSSPAVRYSFTGAIKNPHDVLRGGYLSWHDPVSDHWFQKTFFDGQEPQFRDLGILQAKAGSNIRSMIYHLTPQALKPRRLAGQALVAATALSDIVSKSTNSKATAWRLQIDALLKG